jgi:hypothetical protein
MKKLSPLSALFLIACGTSAPSTSADPASTDTDVGSAEAAIRQLGKNDADVVAKCEKLVKGCEAIAGDSGAGGAVCDEIGAHCADLAEQLSEARDQFQECLQGVASCEASAASPAECRAQRAACNPAGKDFEDRRGATLACAERTQSCLPRGRGLFARGRDDADADAGANQCDDNVMDFVGCCHGHGGDKHSGRADAGAGKLFPIGIGRGPGGPGGGFARPGNDHGRGQNDDDADDTGANSGDGNR